LSESFKNSIGKQGRRRGHQVTEIHERDVRVDGGSEPFGSPGALGACTLLSSLVIRVEIHRVHNDAALPEQA
jgi:hypothetical protein